MTSERENPFYELGYTSPEEAQELRAMRTAKAGSFVTASTAGKSAKRRRRARAAVGPQYGEESQVGYPEGRPEDRPYVPVSAEQAARNHSFAKNWKQIGDEAIRNGTHAVEDN